MRRLSIGLILFAVGNIFVFNLALVRSGSSPLSKTPVGLFRTKLLKLDMSDDSFLAMDQAFQLVTSHGGGRLYEEVFFRQQVKFQYPPTSLLPWFALRSGPASALLGAVHVSLERALAVFSGIAVLATAIFATAVFRKSCRQTFARTDGPLAALAVFTLALFFYPVLKGFELGQVQVWIDALFAAAFWCWMGGHKRTAGVLAALCALLKPQLGLLLATALLRGEWAFAAGFGGATLLGLLLSLTYVTPADYVGYLKVLSFLSRHGEAYYPNQSVNGLVHRLLFNGDGSTFFEHEFAPYHPWVFALTLATSLGFIGLALYVRKKPLGIGRTADFALAALASTMASPIAWQHHYGILVPIYAFLLPPLLQRPPMGKGEVVWLAASFVLASNFIGAAKRLLPYPVLNLGQSYLFAAALIVLMLLAILRRRDPPAALAEGAAA